MQVVLFNDVNDMFENDFIKGKTYFISNGLAKQVNNNFLNVHDTLELMLFVHSRVEEATTNIDMSHSLYNFIELKDIEHHLEANNINLLVLVKKDGAHGDTGRCDVMLMNSLYSYYPF